MQMTYEPPSSVLRQPFLVTPLHCSAKLRFRQGIAGQGIAGQGIAGQGIAGQK
jgi:hypothetical protein